MKSPLIRIRHGAMALVAIFLLAACGYHYLNTGGDSSWLDSIYMVVITISTVGFGERSILTPTGKVLTMALIVFGYSAAGYTIGGLLQLMAEGEIDRLWGGRKMTRDIGRLSGHVVICGFGRLGRMLAEQLYRQGRPFVVIETHSEQAEQARSAGYLVITGDATDEKSLLAAGIDRARVLVTALPSDAQNVFITLTARNLNPRLLIISRGEQPSTQSKLRQAGADRVVMAASIGAQWIATMITRPSTVEFLELVSSDSTLEAELDEITLPPGNRLVGQTVAKTEAGWPHTMLIVAVKSGRKMVFRPDPGTVLSAGDILILLGETQAIQQFRQREGF